MHGLPEEEAACTQGCAGPPVFLSAMQNRKIYIPGGNIAAQAIDMPCPLLYNQDASNLNHSRLMRIERSIGS